MDKNDKNSFENYEKKIEEDFVNSTIFNSEPSDNGKKQQKSTRKKPYIRLLSMLLCAAIVISGSAVAVYYLWPSQSQNGDTTQTTTVSSSVISLTASANVSIDKMNNPKEGAISNISKITIVNKTDTYNIVPYKTETTSDEGEKTEAISYKLLGIQKDIPINNALVEQFASNVFAVDAVRKLDSKYTKADCGLDNPSIKVTVEMADNSEFWFALGNMAPNANEYYYCMCSLKDGIYIVENSVYTNFSKSLKELVDTQVVNTITADGNNDSYFTSDNLTRYDKILIKGKNFKNEVKLDYIENDEVALIYQVSQPVKTYASDEQIAILLGVFKEGLIAANTYVVNPSEKQLENYGVKNAYFDITYVIKNKTYHLKFSKIGVKDNNFVACTINDVPIIYCVSAESVKFIDWTLDDIRYNLLYMRNIDTIKSMTAQYGGKSYKYNLSFDSVEETTTASSDSQTDVTTASSDAETELSVIMNSSPIDADSFKHLYQRIVMSSASKYLDIGENVAKSTPYLKLVMQHQNGKNSETITYTKYNENYYLFRLNGIGDELIAARKVELIMQNFEKLRKGEKVVSPNNQQ